VLLDTNALLLPVGRGFPLDREIDRHFPGARVELPRSALAELDRLVARDVPRASAARALARRYPIAASRGAGDDAILATAARRRAVVVTADRELAARLVERGITVLVPRDRHRLEALPGRPTVRPRRRSEGPKRSRRRGNG
jgi:rRNA-processing protein FCF1